MGNLPKIQEVNTNESFGDWVRGLRQDKAMTQSELAQKMGIAPGYLSRVETGERPPTEPFCIALSSAFGFPIYTVLVRAGLVQDDEEFAAANTLKNIEGDADVWEFKRRIAKIEDKEEKERILDEIWAILDVAAKRSARRKVESEDEGGSDKGKKGRGAAAGEPTSRRPSV